MKFFKNNQAANAFYIAVLCSVSYLAVYFAKNVLSAVSNQMMDMGAISQNDIGVFSSTYFMCYAFGQLINGTVGDKIKAKYMVGFGLILAGISNLVFCYTLSTPQIAKLAYGAMGFFLSMIFGPLSKTIAENARPVYAPRCALGYTFASFLGSPLAGVIAVFFVWREVFTISTVALIAMGSIAFVIFSLLEKAKIVQYWNCGEKVIKPRGKDKIKILIKNDIIRQSAVWIICGIIRTTVVFWLPVYLKQYLGFSAEDASLIFAVVTFIASASAISAVFCYEQFGRNGTKAHLFLFSCSAIGFLMLYFVKNPAVNVVLMVFAIFMSNSASSITTCAYLPTLRETGLTSTAAGLLDFISYMAAAAASALFANAVTVIGWGNLILVWSLLEVVGVVISLPYKRKNT